MSIPNAHRNYQRATVETASPGKLVLMLYDGAIRFLEQAKVELGAGRPKEAHAAIVRAESIVSELMSCLDLDQGGDIAKNLLAVYEFTFTRLVDANVRKDAAPIDEVLPLLRSLRESWEGAIAMDGADRHSGRPQLKAQPGIGLPRLFGNRNGDNGRTQPAKAGSGEEPSTDAGEATTDEAATPSPGPVYRKPKPPGSGPTSPPTGGLDVVT